MMLRPRWPSAGPIGGEGFAAPAGTCNFRYPVTFFAICHSCCADRSRLFQVSWFGSERLATAPRLPRPSRSDLLDLTEFQFDRRGASEDRHRDLDARARLVNFLNHSRKRRERPIGHAHILADLERDRRLRAFHAF